jgi:leucyl aminopeptidase
MQLARTDTHVTQIEADAVVVGVHAQSPPAGAAAAIDAATRGAIALLIENKEITGRRFELVPLLAPAGIKAPQVLVVGLGRADELDRGVAHCAAAAASRHLAGKERRRVAFYLGEGWSPPLVESGVAGALAGCQGQDLYRAEKNRYPFGELLWAHGDEAALESGRVLGESVNLARRLVNEPPSAMYPESFARAAEEAAKASRLAIEVWDERRLAEERCGSLLAVASGSVRPPRLVILRHNHKPGEAPKLALVGKGVTFDSGGLSLKPTDGMKTMKCDMAGAATVVAAMQAIARLELPISVIGLCGLVENMPSGSSFKLGDVLTARNGTTIEVLNTDAEGRLVLADVLDVAVEQGAERIVDLATLTGACVVALGNDVAGLMTNDQAWCDQVAAAARACGEPVWQLPMYADYGELIKSDVADIKNIGDGRWGGAITAAKFLETFVAGRPWTHIDIAGPAFLEKPKPWLDGGASGAYVRALVELARGM